MGERIATEYQRIFQNDRPRVFRNHSDELQPFSPHFSRKYPFSLSLSPKPSDDPSDVRKIKIVEYQGVTKRDVRASSTHTTTGRETEKRVVFRSVGLKCHGGQHPRMIKVDTNRVDRIQDVLESLSVVEKLGGSK